MVDKMESRLDYAKIAPGARDAMLSLEKYVGKCGLEAQLLNLVKIRSSQINGCAWCLDMHTKDARATGETEQRLYTLPTWQDAPFYTERERAALAWTEAVTLISDNLVTDEVYKMVTKQFSEKELVDLTMSIVSINGWNRLNISFRTVAGNYKVGG